MSSPMDEEAENRLHSKAWAIVLPLMEFVLGLVGGEAGH